MVLIRLEAEGKESLSENKSCPLADDTGSSDLRRDPAAWRISFTDRATDRFLDLVCIFSSGLSGVGTDTEGELGIPGLDFGPGESIIRRFFDLNGMDPEEPGALIFQQSQ